LAILSFYPTILCHILENSNLHEHWQSHISYCIHSM
jgi:hypothetical protein